MALKEQLQADLTAAMKAQDDLRRATLRMVLTAVKDEEVAGKAARELSDDEVLKVVAREAKKRREAAEAFRSGGAVDRAERELAEGGVLDADSAMSAGAVSFRICIGRMQSPAKSEIVCVQTASAAVSVILIV